MLATQSEVKLVMREPDTPGGLRLSMAWRPVSRSVTGDAIVMWCVRPSAEMMERNRSARLCGKQSTRKRDRNEQLEIKAESSRDF